MKTIKVIWVLFLLSFFNHAQGQILNKHLEKIVSEYVFELNSRGIDTVIIYQEYCGSCPVRQPYDSCEYGNTLPINIFWLKDGEGFMTLKHDCFDYSVIGVKNKDMAKFINEYLVKFQNEDPKADYFITHSTSQFIQIIIKQNLVFEKELKDYFFIRETPSKEINSHYEYNLNTAIKRFQVMISKELMMAGQEKNIQKIRR